MRANFEVVRFVDALVEIRVVEWDGERGVLGMWGRRRGDKGADPNAELVRGAWGYGVGWHRAVEKKGYV